MEEIKMSIKSIVLANTAWNNQFASEIELINDPYYKEKVQAGLVKFRDPDATELSPFDEKGGK